MCSFNIIKLDAISSTNDYLKVMRRSKKTKDMDLVWAIEQTSGRGQRENKWFSESKAISYGYLNVASSKLPSSLPSTPDPAYVETVPF